MESVNVADAGTESVFVSVVPELGTPEAGHAPEARRTVAVPGEAVDVSGELTVSVTLCPDWP